MSHRRFFSGPSLDRALLQAASHYGVEPDRIKYEPVEKAVGLNKRRGIVIRVDPDDYQLAEGESATATPAAEAETVAVDLRSAALAREAASEPQSEPEPSADEDRSAAEPDAGTDAAAEAEDEPESADDVAEPPVEVEAETEIDTEKEIDTETEDAADPEAETVPLRVPVAAASEAPTGEMRSLPSPLSVTASREPAEGDEADAARAGLAKLFTLAGLELDAVVAQGEEDRLEIDLSGPDAEVVVEEDGEVLLALQHLLPRVMQSTLGRVVQCRLDCEGFHAVREEKLRDLALQTAGQVAGEGRPRTLHPMHPADRRIVHLALAEDPGVVTESVGSGYFKRVKVRTA